MKKKPLMKELEDMKKEALEKWTKTKSRGAARVRCNTQIETIDQIQSVLKSAVKDVLEEIEKADQIRDYKQYWIRLADVKQIIRKRMLEAAK